MQHSLNKLIIIFQGPETWVGVRALRASSGGILDPDDRVCDVADDRETLTAECTNQAPQPRAAQADGASGSSAGTASPDMFRVCQPRYLKLHFFLLNIGIYLCINFGTTLVLN